MGVTKEGMARFNGLRIGLTLSGGGAKGAYEAGFLRAFFELSLNERVVVVSGTSIGALNSLVYAMGDLGLVLRLWHELNYRDVLTKADKADKKRLRDVLRSVSADTMEVIDTSAQLSALGTGESAPFSQGGIRRLIADNVDFDRVRNCGADVYVCAYNIAAERPEYFLLNELDDETIVNATLASAAIPYVFNPVSIGGVLYADGGVDSPGYTVKNSDKTPVRPLAGYDLDLAVVVYLNQGERADISLLDVPVFEVYPSVPLESVRGAGTMNFRRSVVAGRVALGYRDGVAALTPLVMGIMGGRDIDGLVARHNTENEENMRKKVYSLFDKEGGAQ